MRTNIIYNEDCLQGLKKLPNNSADLCITDPPRDIHAEDAGGWVNRQGDTLKNVGRGKINTKFNPFPFLELLKKKLKVFNLYVYVTGDLITDYRVFAKENGYSVTPLIMKKTNYLPTFNNKYLPDKEQILFIRESGAYFRSYNEEDEDGNTLHKSVYETVKEVTPKKNVYHPTSKYVELMIQHIKVSSRKNDIVIDPFIGGGTTAIACLKTDRRFIGYEIQKKHYITATKRCGNFNPSFYRHLPSNERPKQLKLTGFERDK